MKNRILVTGATGNTGRPLVDELAGMDIPFRVMVHSADKIPLVKKGRAEVVVGDLNDPPSLERALFGIEKMYLLSPPSPDMEKVQTAVVDLAGKNGVKHIVKLSALGAAPDSAVGLLRAHNAIEEHIKRSGLTYTILRPHFFMENLLNNAGTVRSDSALFSPLGDAKINPVSVGDIAAVAARILASRGHRNRTYDLTGPASVSYREIADILSRVLERPVTYVTVSFESVRQALVSSGMPEWFAIDLIRLMTVWSEGKGDLVSRDGEKILGRKPLSLKDFFRKHKAVFAEENRKAA